MNIYAKWSAAAAGTVASLVLTSAVIAGYAFSHEYPQIPVKAIFNTCKDGTDFQLDNAAVNGRKVPFGVQAIACPATVGAWVQRGP